MPNYEVEHICPLTVGQQDELAEAITIIHSEHFSTPKLFVNVRFTNISDHPTYVAGKRRNANRIFAYVRHGPSRTQEDYDAVSEAINKAWASITPLPKFKRSAPDPDTELRLIMFHGSIVAGSEVGFAIPPAGEDRQWLKENIDKFQQKADEGDEDFKDMVEDVKSRGLV